MPPMFKDETYTAVLLMMEDTQVKYHPEGKRSGTESYIRYKGYCEAKTVGEALAMGSKPQDLCNDYEKRILTIVGGPVRTEFVDYNAVDQAAMTPTDKAVATFRVTAKRLQTPAPEVVSAMAAGGDSAPQTPAPAPRKVGGSANAAGRDAARKQPSLTSHIGHASQHPPSSPPAERKRSSEEDASKRQPSGMECSPEAKKSKRGMPEDSPEKAARPAKQLETPRAKKARTLATALQSMQRTGSSGEFRCLALALQKMEEPTGEVSLTEYFQSLLSGSQAAQDLTLALELLGSSGPSCPAVRLEAIQRAAGAAFQASRFEGEAIPEAVLEARRSTPRAEGSRAVTLEDIAAVRFAAFHQSDEVVQMLAEALRNSGGDDESREALHLVRLLEGSGPDLSVVFSALSNALGGGGAEAAEAMARAAELAFCECGGLAGRLVDALVSGVQAPMLYKLCSPQLGQPVLPMIRAEVVQDCIDDALCRAAGSPVVLEQLCSGCRVQVHKQGDDVCIFDTCQQDLAVSGRDRLVAGVRAGLKGCSTCILDGVLQKDGQYLRLVAFDCLWLNGQALLRRPLRERREALRRTLTRSDVVCMPAAQEFTLECPPESSAVRNFLRAAAAAGCSGVLLKRLDGIYEAGGVSATWFGLSVGAEPQAAALAPGGA